MCGAGACRAAGRAWTGRWRRKLVCRLVIVLRGDELMEEIADRRAEVTRRQGALVVPPQALCHETIAGVVAGRFEATGAQPRRPGENPLGRLVAGKATAGATSEEVATVLFLSPRTVDAQLRNAFPTPGLSPRRRLREMPLYPSGVIWRNRPGHVVFAEVPVPFGAASLVPAIRASAPEAGNTGSMITLAAPPGSTELVAGQARVRGAATGCDIAGVLGAHADGNQRFSG